MLTAAARQFPPLLTGPAPSLATPSNSVRAAASSSRSSTTRGEPQAVPIASFSASLSSYVIAPANRFRSALNRQLSALEDPRAVPPNAESFALVLIETFAGAGHHP